MFYSNRSGDPYPKKGIQFLPGDWSPDGKPIAGTLDPTGGVTIYSFAGGEYEDVTDTGGGPVWLEDGRRIVCSGTDRLRVIDVKKRTSFGHRSSRVLATVRCRRTSGGSTYC